MPRDHVVTKTFYLLDGFVGRTDMGQTWIEALPPPDPNDRAPRPARAGDSVSPIIVTSNDLAGAWAVDERRRAAASAGARRRAAARNGAARRRQSGDVRADRQLQGRSGARQGSAGKAFALNDWSLAFSPLLPLAWLGRRWRSRRSSLVGLTLWRRPRAALGCARSSRRCCCSRLLDPALQREDRRPLKDVVAVVIDRSERQPARRARARRPTPRAPRSRSGSPALDNVEARVRRDAARRPRQPGHASCSPRCAQALSDTPPERVGGAIIVTDGIAHDIPANAAALGFHAPLHVLVTGHEGERDRRIELVEAPRSASSARSRRSSRASLDSADRATPATLTVRRDGEPIATLNAPHRRDARNPGADRSRRRQHLRTRRRAAAQRADRRSTTRRSSTIEGVRDKLRVLLVSGEPHPGERMWRNLLKSDANVDLVHFTILRPPEKTTDGTPINELSLIAFPVADLFGRKIKDFDLIIFDRYSSQAILPQVYLDNIVKYVRDGGALLIAAGPEFATPGGALQHAARRDFARAADRRGFRGAVPARQISPDGAKHPVTRGLPGADAQSAGLGPLVPRHRRRS